MPFPKTQDVGKVMHALKKRHPDMKRSQQVAIALSQARKAGAAIPKTSGAMKRFH